MSTFTKGKVKNRGIIIVNKAVLEINFKEANVLSSKVINGKLHLKLDWGFTGISETIISKNIDGYTYEDVGLFVRYFKDIDFMFWEYELSLRLKPIVQSLPITEKKEVCYEKGFYDVLAKELGIIK